MKSLVAVFAGEYDIAYKAQLRAELQSLVPLPNIVLDFSEVTYVDSTAITELIRMHKARAQNRFQRETIVVQNQNMLKLFNLHQLQKIFRLVDTLDETLGRDGEPSEVRYAFSANGA